MSTFIPLTRMGPKYDAEWLISLTHKTLFYRDVLLIILELETFFIRKYILISLKNWIFILMQL